MSVNGVLREQRSYDAAHQVVGWQYDAAGNLLADSTHSYGYDALGRMTSIDGVAHTYNGDGVLVASGITRYTQDLVAPLDQVLSDGTSTYVYGAKRLFGDTSGTRTWYTTDLLGSVRQTLSDSGAILTSTTFDPWGVVESGTSAPFGFTGELTAGGLVYLRARWYDPANGIFPGFRWDTSESFDEIPYSHHGYAYALGNPILYTDPAGTYAVDNIQNDQLTADYIPSLKQAAKTYGVPWQVVSGVLESEMSLDTDFKDFLEDIAYTFLPGTANLRPDPGPGIGNIHLSTAIKVSEYFATQYEDCANMQLNFHNIKNYSSYRGHSFNNVKPYLANLLTNSEVNIMTIAGIVRYLADFRFGSKGQPLQTSRASLSTWTISDAVAVWHAYRYGVPKISPGGVGFPSLEAFQKRGISA